MTRRSKARHTSEQHGVIIMARKPKVRSSREDHRDEARSSAAEMGFAALEFERARLKGDCRAMLTALVDASFGQGTTTAHFWSGGLPPKADFEKAHMGMINKISRMRSKYERACVHNPRPPRR